MGIRLDIHPGVRGELSDYSALVITSVAERSGNGRVLVTSLERTPQHQAQAMHDNCVKHGVAAQRALYRVPGNLVIDVFVADVHKSEVDTVADMTIRIMQLGAERVSEHCAAPKIKSVVDLADSAFDDRVAFVAAARADSRISTVLDEPRNGCVHLVIPQPAGA